MPVSILKFVQTSKLYPFEGDNMLFVFRFITYLPIYFICVADG